MALQLYINEKYIELSDESKIGLTFIANDIGSIQNKRANFSNQFKIPKTGNNIEALGYPNILNAQSNLPYEKLSCRLVQDGIEIITNGYGIINDADEFISLTVYNGNIDFFEKIKGRKLTDIDLSDYNHTWNLANIIDNIDNQTNEDCYVYGLIAYGEGLPSAGRVEVKYLLPSIRAKILIEKIFSDAAFTVTINDSVQSLIDKMILPYARNEGQQETTFYTQQLFSVGLLGSSQTYVLPTSYYPEATFYPYGIGGRIPFDDESTPFFDNGGLHSGGQYVASSDMFQTFTANASIDTLAYLSAGTDSASGYITLEVQIISKNNVSGVSSIIASNTFTTYSIPIVTPATLNVSVTSSSVIVKAGDIISVNIKITQSILFFDSVTGLPGGNGTIDFTVNDTCTFSNSTDGSIIYGETLVMSTMLPDMLQSDFIKNILQMTCSQIQTNNYNNEITITSFQDVSESLEVKDWSEKVNDVTDQIKFHCPYAQNNYLKYKSDVSNEVTPGTPNNIGDGVIIVNDATLPTDATMVQLMFAGTVNTAIERRIGSSVYKLLPFINKVDPSTFTFTLKTEPRILLYERETYSNPVRYLGDTSIDPYPYDFLLSANYSTWFIDTVNDRQFQLGFNNNLVQTYFQTLINMLFKYKEVEVEVNLTSSDLNNFFNHSIPVYIEKYQEKFYVNSVNNYQSGKLTKATLIRL